MALSVGHNLYPKKLFCYIQYIELINICQGKITDI